MSFTTEAPVSAPLPTLESIIENNGKTNESTNTPETKAVESKEDQGALERIEREQRARREKFAYEKRIKELESKLGDTSNKASILDEKNPIKALAKQKGLSQDEMVKMALEAMDDDLTEEEKAADLKSMTPSEIAKLVKAELEKERAAEEVAKKDSQAITDFKAKIKETAISSEDKYPLVASLGGDQSAFELINTQFNADEKEFGLEYAQENMLSIDEALKKTNETLASNIKDALKSKHLREFVQKIIMDDGLANKDPRQSKDTEQLEDEEESVTLTNSKYRAATEAAGKPKFRSDAEELDFLINNLT